jgi:hypothetical protein
MIIWKFFILGQPNDVTHRSVLRCFFSAIRIASDFPSSAKRGNEKAGAVAATRKSGGSDLAARSAQRNGQLCRTRPWRPFFGTWILGTKWWESTRYRCIDGVSSISIYRTYTLLLYSIYIIPSGADVRPIFHWGLVTFWFVQDIFQIVLGLA